jgi:hypothetical protein
MTLYLTSDEKVFNGTNSRSNFSNNILPDFFLDKSFNLTLKEIYFDPKFPTLADPKCPHVITLAFPAGTADCWNGGADGRCWY